MKSTYIKVLGIHPRHNNTELGALLLSFFKEVEFPTVLKLKRSQDNVLYVEVEGMAIEVSDLVFETFHLPT